MNRLTILVAIASLALPALAHAADVAQGRSLIVCSYQNAVSDAVTSLNKTIQTNAVTQDGLTIRSPFGVTNLTTFHTNDNNVNDFACVTLTKL